MYFYKTNTKLGHSKQGAVLVGAKVPSVLSSRGDSVETKLNSIALAAILVGIIFFDTFSGFASHRCEFFGNFNYKPPVLIHTY